jgi:methyl-accepting chemotaxis protein
MSGTSGRSSVTDQRLGEIVGIVTGLNEQMKQIREASTRQEDRTNAEAQRVASAIDNIRNEQTRITATITTQISALIHQVSALNDNARQFAGLKDEVRTMADKVEDLEELKAPVKRMVNLYNRMLAYGTIIGVIAFVFWSIFGEVLKRAASGLVEHGG